MKELSLEIRKRNIFPNEVDILLDGPEWMYDRFIRDRILDIKTTKRIFSYKS